MRIMLPFAMEHNGSAPLLRSWYPPFVSCGKEYAPCMSRVPDKSNVPPVESRGLKISGASTLKEDPTQGRDETLTPSSLGQDIDQDEHR